MYSSKNSKALDTELVSYTTLECRNEDIHKVEVTSYLLRID